VSQLIEYVEYLIDNIFVRVSNKVYKKVLGIPMDTECAPPNLFYYKLNFMKETLRKIPTSMMK